MPCLGNGATQATFYYTGMSRASNDKWKNCSSLRFALSLILKRMKYRTPSGPGDEEVLQDTSTMFSSCKLNNMSLGSNEDTEIELEKTDCGCCAGTVL